MQCEPWMTHPPSLLRNSHFAACAPPGFLANLLCRFRVRSYRNKYPLNMYLLGAWTFVEAYTVGVVCAAYASQGQVCAASAGVEPPRVSCQVDVRG